MDAELDMLDCAGQHCEVASETWSASDMVKSCALGRQGKAEGANVGDEDEERWESSLSTPASGEDFRLRALRCSTWTASCAEGLSIRERDGDGRGRGGRGGPGRAVKYAWGT